MPQIPTFSTELLLNAMRQGRANTLQDEQDFTQGTGQALATVLARQGLNDFQPGLTAALAKQAQRRRAEQAVEQDYFNQGVANTERADIFGQLGDVAATAQTLTMQNLQGRLAEQQLRQIIQRIRDTQHRSELLDLLGQAAGLGVTAAIL